MGGSSGQFTVGPSCLPILTGQFSVRPSCLPILTGQFSVRPSCLPILTNCCHSGRWHLRGSAADSRFPSISSVALCWHTIPRNTRSPSAFHRNKGKLCLPRELLQFLHQDYLDQNFSQPSHLSCQLRLI